MLKQIDNARSAREVVIRSNYTCQKEGRYYSRFSSTSLRNFSTSVSFLISKHTDSIVYLEVDSHLLHKNKDRGKFSLFVAT